MIRIAFISIIFVILSNCNASQTSESYQFDKLLIQKFPPQAPSALPRSFFPEDAKFIASSELKSNFSNLKEASLRLTTEQSETEVKEKIKARAKLGDWSLVDETKNGESTTFLLEGFVKKSLSIVVAKSGNLTEVHFLYKKQSNY
ncbi:MAG: hypothetical protein O9301_13055 [Leptospira sp.]|nr:hypothetical protein [Leptospira sp.]